MKNLYTTICCLFICLLLSSVALVSCKNGSKIQKVFSKDEGEEEQDGILETQKREFLMTRDPALGIIPQDRLVNATEQLQVAMRDGVYPELINGLVWSERGSNTDAVGPSNGNGRPGSPTPVTSGRIRAIWVDLSDVSFHTVWLGGVDGGIWKTNDISANPATWTPINDQLGNLAIGSICQDPSNHNTMYFGTGEKTFNVDAVQGGGVWKSTDHGVTWNLLPSTVNFWNVSKIICDNAGNIYVGTIGGGNGLQRSTDGGTTWANITPTTAGGGTRIADIEYSSTGRLHVSKGYLSAANQFGYFYTDNPSTVTSGTWTSPAVSYTSAQYNVDLTSAGNTLYALPSNASDQTPTVYKSTDGGANWAACITSPPIVGDMALSSGQGWYCLGIAVDPTNANNVMVGGLNGYRTTNGGTLWTANSDWVNGLIGGTNQYIHADHQVIVWNGDQVLDAGDGGIFYSANDAVTFTDRNVGLRLKQFYSVAIHPTIGSNYMLAGAQDNGVHQLNGAGLTSSVEVTGGDGAFVHIDQDEPLYQWGSYVYNNYRRSINGGSSWTAPTSNNTGSFINPTDYDNTANIMYCGGIANRFIRWSNAQTGGTLSSVVLNDLSGGYVSHVMVSPYTANRVFFGGGNDPATGLDGGLILMVDGANAGGSTVTDITGATMPANSNVSCIAIGSSDNNLLATFSNYGVGHVWVSTSGGGAAGWTDVSGDLPDIPVRWAMFDPYNDTRAIIATEMGVYETAAFNGSSTVWTHTPSFPVVRTDMLQYRAGDGTIAAATHGRGVWTTVIPPAIRFASSTATNAEATGTTTGCRNYTDYTVNMTIQHAPTGTANVTVAVAGGATATQGVDYDFTTNGNFAAPSTTVTFTTGVAATPQPVTIRVYNDAEIESSESFTLNFSIGGGTNAVADVANTTYQFTINDNDAVPVSGTNAIATVAGTSRTEHLGNNGDYYFYSGTSIINRINGASLSLGCVTSSIFEAGNTWQSFAGGGQRSQKVFDVAPTTNPGATYTISLYFTAAELTGEIPNTLRIAKTTAATMAAANASNTIIMVTPAPVAYGTGWVYTVTFTGFSKFFLVDAGVVLPVSLLTFNGQLENGKILLDWSTSSEHNSQKFGIEKSADGSSFYPIGDVLAAGNSTSTRNYGFTDKQVNEFNYYRLKLVDIDGRYSYSQVILIKNPNAAQDVRVVNNPFGSFIEVRFTKIPKQTIRMELVNLSGALVHKKEYGPADRVRFDLEGLNISRGSYILRTTVDGKLYVNKLIKQ